VGEEGVSQDRGGRGAGGKVARKRQQNGAGKGQGAEWDAGKRVRKSIVVVMYVE
jgi:hypothetical protein